MTKVAATRSSDKARLPWVEHLVSRPLDAAVEAERFTAHLYRGSMSNQSTLQILEHMAEKLTTKHQPANRKKDSEPQKKSDDPLVYLSENIHATREHLVRALASLSNSEIQELRKKIVSQTTKEITTGHRFGGEDHGARLVDLMLRVDLNEILNAGRQLGDLTLADFIQKLERFYQKKSNRSVLREMRTPDGVILIGGEGPNVYRLDQSVNVCAVIDFGGDDIYDEGSVTAGRPVVVIIDLGGNDIYRGRSLAIQGSAILGASLLYDRAGDDTYKATDLAQGSSLVGVGILLDEAGDDSYMGDRRVQGQSTGGFGILIDRSGHDQYRAALLSQGVGGPLGAGLLLDQNGNDRYFAGGKYVDSYEDSPGFGGWSQGVG
ncbi:MAG: hypothetical protein ACRD4B_04525, partial [Acidobacteriota bacterium]